MVMVIIIVITIFSSIDLENKTPWDTYCRAQLICKKGLAHISLEPPSKYNQAQMSLTNQD